VYNTASVCCKFNDFNRLNNAPIKYNEIEV
jgi:hypothetical protein